MNLVYSGKVWVFGDNVGVDGDMMPLKFALSRETDLDVLREHFMSGIDPDFHKKCSPGDVIVAGRRFAQGNPHIQGLLGVRACGLGLVVESIPRGSLRNAVNAGVPILPSCPGVRAMFKTGQEIEVDFRAGAVVNRTTGEEKRYEPLPEVLLATIEMGGWRPMVEKRIAERRAGRPN